MVVISSFPVAGPQCESSEKKGATHLEDAVVSNIDGEVMSMFQSVSIL